MEKTERYDVVILGTGITGAILGALLARNGVRTLLVEQGVHPRFAIGESTVPETTFLFRLLAARYDVPEIANLSTYYKARRHVSATCGVKRNFTFAFHREGERHRPTESNQLSTLAPPLGPDMHMFRQDVDSYLLSVAASYGAVVRQRTDVTEVTIDGPVRLRTKQGLRIEAEYVVDAGGIKAPLARMFGLRIDPPPLRTHSRAMYTHMYGVKPFDACTDASVHGLPSPISQGTLHHIFQGGWMWVIPFDNHPSSTNRLCSVGLMLDPRVHGATDLPPEESFRAFIARFPSLAEQFQDAHAIRDWTAANRLQFTSTQGVGERYCLVPHAYAFVDALFSTGLTMSMGAINMLASRLLQAKKDGDYSLARFAAIGDQMKKNVDYFDQLVARSYVAFRNFELWNAWYRVWTIGTVYGGLGMADIVAHFYKTRDKTCFDACEREPYAGAQANDLPEYRRLFTAACQIMDSVEQAHVAPETAASRILELIEESGLWPKPWGDLALDVRHPGAFTVQTQPAFLKWLRREAPECVRNHYGIHFDLPAVFVLSFLDLQDEIRHSAGNIALLARDFFQGTNRDWQRSRSTSTDLVARSENARAS